MEITQHLSWQHFKETLLLNPGLDLQFQYAADKLVNASYHITEIKEAKINSVDCGGILNAWTEIIVQLWLPEKMLQEKPMKVRKALSIIDIVEKKLILNPDGIVKIEFGSSEFDTRQMYPVEFIMNDESITVNLIPDETQCKAIERAEGDEKNTVCCSPGGGCC